MQSQDSSPQWVVDVLEGFERRSLPLPGGDTATLIRMTRPAAGAGGPTPKQPKPAVLYLHGFVDYFFQAHLAEAFEARGYRFYAVELRGYGRSLENSSDPDHPNFVRDIAVYHEDLDAAAAAIAEEEGHGALVGLGHSTGGLIMPLWAAAAPNRLQALILNSPWLDLNGNWVMRGPVTGAMHVLARVAPMARIYGLKVHYGRALHRDTGGEWDYDLGWKPHDGFPTYPVWLSSVRRWQARVKKGIEVGCPVLMMTSLRRGDPAHDHPEILTTDSILDPRQMWRIAPKLGIDVEVRSLEGGAHDLALSPEPVRTRFLEESLDWLDRVLDRPPDREP